MNTHILWATHNRNHWEIFFKGSYEECQNEIRELGGDQYEIHPNRIIDSWDNEVRGMHFDIYADGTTIETPIK